MRRDCRTTRISATELLGLLNTMTPEEGQRATTEMEPLIVERERGHAHLAKGTDVNAIPLPDPPPDHGSDDAGAATAAAVDVTPSVIVDPSLPSEPGDDVIPVSPIEVDTWCDPEPHDRYPRYPEDDDDVADDIHALTVGTRVTLLLLSATLVLTLVAGSLAISIV